MREALRIHSFWWGCCPLLGRCLYVWVRGCPRRCPGCFNTDMLHDNGAALEVTPDEVVSRWKRKRGGLVLSGGEPFSQAASLATLCLGVRAIEPQTPVLVFTGYRIEELLGAGRRDWLALMRQADVIVDGPFIQSRVTDMPLVGSDNQRVVLLGDRVLPERLDGLRRARIQASLDPDGFISLVGTGGGGLDMNAVVKTLRDQGLAIEG